MRFTYYQFPALLMITIWNHDNWWNLEENLFNLVVSTVPAVVLELKVARTSTGSVVTRYPPFIYGPISWRMNSLCFLFDTKFSIFVFQLQRVAVPISPQEEAPSFLGVWTVNDEFEYKFFIASCTNKNARNIQFNNNPKFEYKFFIASCTNKNTRNLRFNKQ